MQLKCFEGSVNYGYIEKRGYEDFDSDSSSASVKSNAEIWNVHNSDVVFSPTVLSVYFLTVENWCKAWVKTLASFFRGKPRPLQPHSCCAAAVALMTLCQKFISFRRVQSKRVVLQQVMLLIDSYSCSCPRLGMLLCTCCEPGNGLIVWFYAILFVFERLLLLCLLIQVKKQIMLR